MEPEYAWIRESDERFRRRLDESLVDMRRIFRKWTLIQCSAVAVIGLSIAAAIRLF